MKMTRRFSVKELINEYLGSNKTLSCCWETCSFLNTKFTKSQDLYKHLCLEHADFYNIRQKVITELGVPTCQWSNCDAHFYSRVDFYSHMRIHSLQKVEK
jgi:hypothetical protein